MTDQALLVCLLATEHYAVPLSSVREVTRWRAARPIPGTPPTILGVIHQRGVVVPVVDIRSLLGLDSPAPGKTARLVHIEHGGTLVALVTDCVEDIWTPTAPAEAPPMLPAEQARLLSGVQRWHDAPLAVLQVAALFETLLRQAHA